MQNKLLGEIITEIAGEQSKGILELLENKRDVNEFLIAKKLKLTINQVRNIFYKLANFGLVSFIRKKEKKKGWYTYFWTLNILKVLDLLEKRLEKEIESLKQQLKSRETRRFYLCKTCKTEVGEENALLHNFVCGECGEVYELNEDKKILELLKSRIARLQKQREEILQEMVLCKELELKKAEKEVKKKKGKTKTAKKKGKISKTKLKSKVKKKKKK
ncbi:hypothetical protein HYW76_01240 [Candidatus Pacearchaeota archaeon]|nr:hypothetical protein [Candidatus Pacearchaeota archaeon]